jgi:hypothetical protein
VSDLTIEVLKDIRGELRELRTETQGLRAEMKQGLGEVRAELNQGLADVRAELKHGLGEVRDELHELAEYTQAGFAAVLAQGDRRFLDHERRLRLLEEHTGLEPRRG